MRSNGPDDAPARITRRAALGLGLSAAGAAGLPVPSSEAARYTAGRKMAPGEFAWTPERSPSGPVVMIVSLPEQLVHIYRNGIEIGVSTCSTGRPGHKTPTGVFTILEKQRKHVSSIYKGAQMPNMERLTWGGIALHAGNLPGYPASHGCVRLPLKFSALLFDVTHLGVVVIIADERTQPASVVHPAALLPDAAAVEATSVAEHVAKRRAHGAWDATVTYPTTHVVISRRDGKAIIVTDGKVEGSYPVTFKSPARPLGTHTYSLVGPTADGKALSWLAFGIGKSSREAHIVTNLSDTAMRRVVFSDPERALRIARMFHPGTTLLLTDASAPGSSRHTGDDFAIIASEPV
ncbi:MAG TPA: L,D-transpeptidase family protein [Hyphomicrobiaceae bacterium]|nr:L,D-transpeptidase family protein [Hyphomicrobiaceae bacterium]